MIDWTEAENRMQAHYTTTDRINRQGWHQDADRSDKRFGRTTGGRVGHRLVGAVRSAPTLCRTAGRLFAVPTHWGAQSS
jgi:hypothetical protein